MEEGDIHLADSIVFPASTARRRILLLAPLPLKRPKD